MGMMCRSVVLGLAVVERGCASPPAFVSSGAGEVIFSVAFDMFDMFSVVDVVVVVVDVVVVVCFILLHCPMYLLYLRDQLTPSPRTLR